MKKSFEKYGVNGANGANGAKRYHGIYIICDTNSHRKVLASHHHAKNQPTKEERNAKEEMLYTLSLRKRYGSRS